MIANPLDWTAGPFLTLYAAVAGLSGLAIAVARGMIGGSAKPYQGRELVLLELAWLAGGLDRAADTVMVSLLNAGAASIERNRWFVVHASDEAPLPNDMQAFRRSAIGTGTRSEFRRSIRDPLEPIHQGLVARGLAPSQSDIGTIRLAFASILLIPVLLGLAKIEVGLSRGRPVGFLTTMLILTVLFGFVSLWHEPHRTRSGSAALTHARSAISRVARAPLGGGGGGGGCGGCGSD